MRLDEDQRLKLRQFFDILSKWDRQDRASDEDATATKQAERTVKNGKKEPEES
jgi:hypothetical protein